MIRLAHVSIKRSAVVALLFWAAACSKTEPSNDVEIVGGAAPCSGCRVQLGPPLELRAQNGASDIASAPVAVSVDGLGRYWVIELNQPARVYDANGKFLRTLGQKGAGPTELGPPYALLPLPGDSMLVFNSSQNTAFVVDSQFKIARTLNLPGLVRPGSADGWPDRMLLAGVIKTPASDGWTLHVTSATQSDVKVEGSFGGTKISAAAAATMGAFPVVTAARDGGYWSVNRLAYQIRHFAKDGRVIATIERKPDWFPAPSSGSMGTPNEAPPPQIIGVWQAPDGLLWVFGKVPGKNWRSAWPELAPGATNVDVSRLKFDKMYGTVIDVIDPITRDLVSSTTLDDYVFDLLPNGNVAVFAVDSTTGPSVSVRRLSLGR